MQTTIQFDSVELDSISKNIYETALTRAARYLVAEADLLDSIVTVDRHRLFEKFGFTHLTPFCVAHFRLSEDVAGCFVRVARKSAEVPELKNAVDEGLSISKAKTIASVITSENKEDWIEKAKTSSKADLEKEVASASPQSPKPEKVKPVGEKRYRVEFELSEEEMLHLRRAQDLAGQKAGRFQDIKETHAEMLKCYLFHNDPVEKAERNSKKEAPPKKSHRSQDGSRRAAIPAQVLHAVNLRDNGCCQAQRPDGSICKETKWVHFHHIIAKANGGPDTPENLVTLCSGHHRMWHARKNQELKTRSRPPQNGWRLREDSLLESPVAQRRGPRRR